MYYFFHVESCNSIFYTLPSLPNIPVALTVITMSAGRIIIDSSVEGAGHLSFF